ncbi:MAG: hypothetical protein ACO3NR_06930, partial [Rhodothermales bacterium]
MATPAAAGSNAISDDNRAECKIEGNDIGVEGLTLDVDGVIVTFSNWVQKDGEAGEYIGFDIDVESTFRVKSGLDLSTWTGTTWKNPYGIGGPNVKAISNIDFLCDGPPGGPGDPMDAVDLELDKAFDGPEDGKITYTITIENNAVNATVDAMNVVVKDVLPEGAGFDSYEETQGVYDNVSGEWRVGTIAPGASASLIITATVTDADDLDNCAEVASANEEDADSTPGNDSSDEDDDACVVVPNGGGGGGGGGGGDDDVIDLELTKEVNTSSPALDEVVEFTITVTNQGPDNATGLIVRDIIPVGLVYQDYTSSRGTYEAGVLGYWTIGDLAVGQTETLQIRTQVVITNMIENIAQVSHVDQEDVDSTPGNGVPSEDDQDNAILETRGPGSVGDIVAVECADLGTVNALVYSVEDDQIYSGTEVGTIHISNDDGQSWPAFFNTDDEAPVTDIVLGADSRVYAGSFGSGVYESENAGDSWDAIGPAAGSVNDLDVDDDTGTLYAASEDAVISWDGTSWTTVGAGTNPFVGDQVLAVVYQESNDFLFASSAASGTWLFHDGSWSDASNGLPNGKVNVLYRTPAGVVLAGHNNSGVFMWGGAHVLNGDQWVPYGTGLDSEPIESIGSGPNGEVLAGSRETGAYYLNAATSEWLAIGNLPIFTVSAITGGPTGEVYAGAPGEGIYAIYDENLDGIPEAGHQVANFLTNAVIQDLVVAPNGDMWAASYGYGVLYSSDGGNCWTRMNRGLDNLWTFAIERTSGGTLFIGIWADGLGGVWRSEDEGRNWEYLAYGTRQIISLAVDPADDDVIYAGANISGEGALFRSLDGGDTWGVVGTFIYPVWSVTVDPANSDHVVVGTLGSGVYESLDQGESFDQIGSEVNGLDNPHVFDLVYGPAGAPYNGGLFAATNAGAYTYDAGSDTWGLFGDGGEDFQFRTIAFAGADMYGGTWNAGIVQYDVEDDEWVDYGLADMPVVAFAVHQQTETLVIGTSGSGFFLAQNMMMSTSVEGGAINTVVPTSFALDQNYPNPFNPQTTIPFDLSETTHVTMAVYDL